jgi:hypothetical protein
MVKRGIRKYSRRNRKSGGGWGFTGQTIPGVSNYGQVNTPMGDCRAQEPPGYISSYSGKGLPGLSGGGWSPNDPQFSGTGSLAKQEGGRYSFDLADPIPGSAAPWAGGIPTVQRIPCEAAVHNPLNKQMGGFSMKNVYRLKKRFMKKMPGMKNVYGLKRRFTRNLKGLRKYTPSLSGLKRLGKSLKKRFTGRGGKFSMKNVYRLRNGVTKKFRNGFRGLKKFTRGLKKRFTGRGGGLGTDSAAYYAPTAGYDNKPSSWLDSVGAPVQLQIPYDAKAWNPACLKTN